MEFVANYVDTEADPSQWAAQREAEGWHVIAASDHFWTGSTVYPHMWVTLTRQALATGRIRVTSSFSNNLLRSPVEFVQASLALQQASGGRFEAGLGAGWAEAEIRGASLVYPPAPERARRYVEALEIAGQLLRTGMCQHEGEYYSVDAPDIGPHTETTPPLVGSCGGPWLLRRVPLLVDRLELKGLGRATRGGALDLAALATVTRDEVRAMADSAREVRPDLPLGMFTLTGLDTDERGRAVGAALGDGFFGGFFGEPAKVADNLNRVRELGLGHVQLTEMAPGTLAELAPHLLG